MEKLIDQYQDATNLGARIKIHDYYSTNKNDWFLWLFDQYEIEKESTILELGCGDGTFWAKNETRIPPHWQVTLSDFSSGMIADAEKKLKSLPHFQYKQINVENIPYPDDSFDIVIAHYMLYHVPDRSQALQEIRRVLKPGGKLYAATIGKTHLKEFGELVSEFDSNLVYSSAAFHAKKFGLENGAEQLASYFSTVELKLFSDGLKVPTVQPIVDYLLSTHTDLKNQLTGKTLEEFKMHLEQKKKDNKGFIAITKSAGLFEAK
ncbi:class I SAM-dependent methyltransferase [Planococcus halotolerans]|uniref:Methyltransferase type 11 domain-containing protein n=1 Tax=Planococcus halotolerans TaxID=2233542 RepID=A0A365L1P4_9BACL|nr:class I SAM-dependent methyltransferase [Planococcus halotolerans]RAZ79294.1 hypothetical protein DP120_06695 [Planococcus halotolerans]